MKYYSLYNNSMKFFNRPFIANDDIHAKALIRNVIISDETGSARADLSDAALYFVGTFDNVKGKFKAENSFICNVSDIPIPEVKHEKV